jgi:prepilin peptidase CpaA
VYSSILGVTNPFSNFPITAILGGDLSLSSLLIFICGLVASVTDLYGRKIYNTLTFTVMMLGIPLQGYESGFAGIAQSFLGIGTGLLLLGWLFVFRIMGAGDVKLLMAFGAVGGAKYCLNVAALSLFIGVLLSLFVLIKERKIKQTAQRIGFFFVTLLIKEFSVEYPKSDEKLKVPYGFALSIAAIWLLFSNPLAELGLLPWN